MGLSIGLCYDLKDDYLRDGFAPEDVLEFDSEETVAGLEAAMAALGHSTERVGRGRELARRFVEGERWDLVFNICEGVWGRSREAQVPALCELFDQPYTFADPLTCAVTLDKAIAKRIVRDHGLATAPFSIVSSPEEAESVRLPVPLFLKPVAEGSSKGVTGRSLVRERRDLDSACRTLLEQFKQPVLVEAFLPGREVTVGIVGHGATARVVGVMEVSFTDRAETLAYTALNKEEYQDRVTYHLVSGEPLAEQARDAALAVFRALGCRDAARVDLRCDAADRLNFLEVNPLPGINHVRSDLPIMVRLDGTSYQELIGAIIDSARSRYGL
ncbi:MAG: D-alanine--D-alanine ligase [Thermoanaerobaculaceae bacterium]|jgi:D-alanine-D-alanine ligase